MTYERGVVPEDWSAMIVPLYKGKGERTGCSKRSRKNMCRDHNRQSS